MRGLYWKIYFSFVLTSVLATLVTLAYAVFYRQLSNETNNLIAPTEGYISSAQLMLQRGGEPLLIEWLITFEQHPNVNAYVFDQQGSNLAGGKVPATVSDYAFSASEFHVKVQPLNRSEILVKAPLTSQEGVFYLLVVEFLHPFAVLDVKSYIALGLLVAIIFFAVVGFILSGYLSRPMRRLQKTVKAIAGGDLSARSGYRLRRRRDEIGDLSREFDVMADRLQTLLADQKGLLRDISHELRSPLARLQIATELARFDANDDAVEYLDRIELETGRINDLIADILLLAKLEVERHPEQWQPIDLVEVIENIVGDAHFEKQADVIQFIHPKVPCFVMAEAKLLSSAFENLIRNALLHTYDHTKVEITIKEIDSDFSIVVRDNGPGVAEEHIQNLTQPFYRAEHSRERVGQNMTQKQAGGRGYGLGMAIAHRVIRSFDGHMAIRNHPQGGLEISCYLNRYF
ncbi:MAG: HAMP domain-containing histidine kinase [Oleispira antarctica]|uniref:histidine kinase n=1 Tax=Oleispira antarctica RB-8 TaxID=698738 RepID=R4YQI2_OLEAN|nr:HAMP domain-containing histidine kinase [Oleispira antarctica]MBQ0792627.1 HAMP domain-containing histidine kinase [Oleispira antarctica]CCK77357.1 Sensor protein [Oleispira antarctica RB-8]|tara:strand:- start:3807 stop:5183 length:1377 start_codon:yes stop_codon:yes gene_type:complete